VRERFRDAAHPHFEFFSCDMVRSRRTNPSRGADFAASGWRGDAVRDDLALLPDDAPALFPVFLKLASRHCLAVGGGKVAEPRIESLLTAKASLLVVAPKVTSNVHQWAKEKKLVWEERPFELHDLNGMGW
jgi:hypothetical protein